MDLGLTQPELAGRLEVDPATILHWERGNTRPGAVHLGRITAFLGYFPLAEGSTFPERVLATRQRLGLTQVGLAAVLAVGEEAVRNWERGRRRPQGERLRRVEEWIVLGVTEVVPL
jgi:transcriptional regulator with XRE-family HTH domain